MTAFVETAKLDPILAFMLQRFGSARREHGGVNSSGKTAALVTVKEVRQAMAAIRSDAQAD